MIPTYQRRWEILTGVTNMARRLLAVPIKIEILGDEALGWHVALDFERISDARKWATFFGSEWVANPDDDGNTLFKTRFKWLLAGFAVHAREPLNRPEPWTQGPDSPDIRDAFAAMAAENPWMTEPAPEDVPGQDGAPMIFKGEPVPVPADGRTLWTGTPPGHGPGGLPHGYVPGACGDECNNAACPVGRPHDVCVTSCAAVPPEYDEDAAYQRPRCGHPADTDCECNSNDQPTEGV